MDPSLDVAATGRYGDGVARPPISLYIHIPFCKTKCTYCDFNTYSGIENLLPSYLEALEREIRIWGALLEKPAVGTIFFGGGTPSYLPAEQVTQLLRLASTSFSVSGDAEVTLEANPEDLSQENLSAYHRAGFNRLSIGAQSFDDALLRTLGRNHTASDISHAVARARASGFDNVSLDLLFGLPSQTINQWSQSLEQALNLAPEHVSLYSLTLEPGTPLDAEVKAKRVPRPDPDLSADMYVAAETMMSRSHYIHYEIANWALPGLVSKHNLAYWRLQPFLGIGPGAHSLLLGKRFSVIQSPRTYIKLMLKTNKNHLLGLGEKDPVTAVSATGILGDIEQCTLATRIADFLMMGLRLHEGICPTRFKDTFGMELETTFGAVIEETVSDGLIESCGNIRLTHRGRLLGNQVFGRFVSEAHRLRSLTLV